MDVLKVQLGHEREPLMVGMAPSGWVASTGHLKHLEALAGIEVSASVIWVHLPSGA